MVISALDATARMTVERRKPRDWRVWLLDLRGSLAPRVDRRLRGGKAFGNAAVDRAIVLDMQPRVTVDEGIEAVLLDRATAPDVRAGRVRADRGRPIRGHEGVPAGRLRSPLPFRHRAGG